LAILDARRTDLLAGAATETAIDVTFECSGVVFEPALSDRAHQVEAAARSIVLIASDDVGRARFQAQAAVNAGQQFVLFTFEQGR
jgi:hypothetical protein